MANWLIKSKSKDKPARLSLDWATKLSAEFSELVYVRLDKETVWIGKLSNSNASLMREDPAEYPIYVEFVAHKEKYQKNKKKPNGSFEQIEIEPNKIELLWALGIPKLILPAPYQASITISDGISAKAFDSLMNGEQTFLPMFFDGTELLDGWSDFLNDLMLLDRSSNNNENSYHGGLSRRIPLNQKITELIELLNNGKIDDLCVVCGIERKEFVLTLLKSMNW